MSARALVTGGAGFIGSHVVDALVAEGREVTVVDDLSTGHEDRVNPAARLERIDIVDREGLERAFARSDPQVVFHLAAQASVTASVEDPVRDCEVNVRGTLNVVDLANARGAPVVFTSTGGALYGDEAPLPTDEHWIPAPLAPYGASKWGGESYVSTWSQASGVPNAICRLGNVYGPRQNPHGEAGVVAIFSWHLHSGQSPTLFGNGKPTRDYVHADDVVRALMAAAGHRGTFNIATGLETDVMALWESLRNAAGSDLEPRLEELRPGELKRSCLDASRAKRELGWRAEIPIDEGLLQTYGALVEEFQNSELTR
jgi:UDP-glucose 4-epimerase